MKILQVCPKYYPYVGGVETCVKETSERLAKRFDIEVLTIDHSGKLPKEDRVNCVTIRRFKSWVPNETYALPYSSMLSYLSSEQADIIHAHNLHALTTFMAYVAHRLHTKPKFVVSPLYHGRGHNKLAQMLWILHRPLAKKILINTDGILVNSRAQRSLIERTFKPLSKIFLVYDGVNLIEIKNAEPFTFDENRKILLYVGRLAKYKNIHVAIASMKYLPENYHFFIIGCGPYRPFLENLSQSLGLQGRVHFLGFQPDDVVHRWLKTSHVFVHLSAVESFGMTCIESLAAGTPVIANDDGFGLSETIALYPRDIVAFMAGKEPAYKLAQLMMQVAELKPITVDISQFSWDLIAGSVSAVYKQILVEQ